MVSSMRLVCPKCDSQYEVDLSLFPEEGREVQCSNCEEVWIQYPVTDPLDPPMRLDAMAATAPRPSDRLDEAERSSLREAVAEEIDVQNRDYDRRGSFADDTAAVEEDDTDIIKSLRKQIKAEGGGKIDKNAPAKSQKRNLRDAAEAVGVDVDAVEDDESDRRKWNLSSHETARAGGKSGRRDGLREALERYEDEVGSMRPRRRVRKGFLAAVVLVILGAGVYMARDQISEAVPQAAPYLDQYAQAVDDARLKAEEIYVEYQPIIMGKITELTGGGSSSEGG